MSSNPTYDELAVGSTMEDTFLRDFMSAGVYDFASDIGIIQDGQIPSVKMHEQNLPVNQWNNNGASLPQTSQAFQPRSQPPGAMFYGAGHPMPQPGDSASARNLSAAAARGQMAGGPGLSHMSHMGQSHGGHMAHMHGQFVNSSAVLRANQHTMPGAGGGQPHTPASTIPTASIPTVGHNNQVAYMPQAGVGVGLHAMQMGGVQMSGGTMQQTAQQNSTGNAGGARGGTGAGGGSGSRSGAGGGGGSGRKKGGAASGGLVGEKGTPSTEGFQLKKKRKSGKGSVPDKGGKGLRHFSMKVCTKVESKGRTTYNEVADELVSELSNAENGGSPDVAYDEKNIRRRVYDALNVLMAMDIISKEKKEISWKGLPTTRENNVDLLKEDQKRVAAQVEKKRVYLKELVGQKKAIEALIERNKANPSPQVKQEQNQDNQATQYGVQLPFLVVQTRPDAKVDVQISEDRQFVSFDFTYNPFEIHDENYVLHHMVRNSNLKLKQ